MLKVLIADDHAILRRGLREILTREFVEVNCVEVQNSQQVLAALQNGQLWDLLLLDVSMPGRSGLDVLKEIRMAQPRLPILVVSMHAEDQYGKRTLAAGASGYLNKESAPEELIKAIRKVLAGGRYVSAFLGEKLALHLDAGAGRSVHEALSNREFEVLRMLGAGKSVSQIAEELHLSVPTVSTYRARMLEKMQLSTTAELIHYALSNSLSE